ncbi:MAG: hypothetical protein JRN23_06100 [Nitrososphaerota archaeon]|nr:hypothetical protein [Nitrososphaerota archaeon]MDG6978716.1 hypothetical protein [Nitrososphaerota archaeon]MDG7021484.1 hypothetical protein [Nitrososphaerota archaeon]
MTSFKPRIAQPGGTITSDDWNYIQQGILEDLVRLETENAELRRYVDNMSETNTMTRLDSPEGRSYGLDEKVPGEAATYGTSLLGFITRQWLPSVRDASVDICRFTVANIFDQLDYWAGADNGGQKALDITIRYVDGTSETVKGLLIHERKKLSPRGEENPYVEFLLSPNQWVWYRYRLANPHPDKEVLTVTFRNSNPKAMTRIADAVQLRTRVKQLQ